MIAALCCCLAASVPPVPLSWLGGTPPPAPSGVSWGVPWPRGAVPGGAAIAVQDADGRILPTQSWPLAYWPDGSAKWTGLAIAADAHTRPLAASPGAAPAPASPVRVKTAGGAFEVSTGPLVCRLSSGGANLIDSLIVDGREVGRDARLIAIREDRSRFKTEGLLREVEFTSAVTGMAVEQSGPVRAVIRIDGVHRDVVSGRRWLPFTVRLYFTSGLSSIRMVHSFVYDGDAASDFIRGLGLKLAVPFREEKQNRHVRFAGEDQGFWSEPVLMSPGYVGRGGGAAQLNRRQLAGERIPNLAQLDLRARAQFATIAVWDAFKLTQLSPDSFSIDKRTNADSSWLHVGNGRRAGGFAFIGDVSGGLAVGVKGFWQKYPAALEVTGAASPAAELKVWFWSPDTPPMDLRHYDTIGHNGASYEDHQDGFSTPYGVANTHELTLWATPGTPNGPALGAMQETAARPPLLVSTPAYYHAAQVLGVWSLPERATPDRAAMEAELDRAFAFYQREVELRRWYGFWDYGDFMRTYDPRRHEWMYDIGGHAWNNTELMPNLWLWYSFLRTGRADIFQMAEAMTRNTGEVDVYHLGPFFGLGSRHNVSHWGDGAKEARISEALLKRPYYYLTTDERTGDLMREVLTVDRTIARIQPLRHELVRPDEPIIFRIAPDWEALAGNWMTEWERTGDTRYRDYVLTGMKSLAALPGGIDAHNGFRFDLKTKQLFDIGEPNQRGGYFMYLFGGDDLVFELNHLIDCPPFVAAWNRMAEKVARSTPVTASYYAPRITAYVAYAEHDSALGRKAWDELRSFLATRDVRDRFPEHPALIHDWRVPTLVQEIPVLDTPGTSQWALNLIEVPELARAYYEPPGAR